MKTTYRELVVKGNASILKGFLWGFKTAKKIKKGLLFCADHPIQTHHIKDLLKFQGDHVHIIASAKVHEAILHAIREAAERLEFEIVSDKRIKDAHFGFKFETFSRDVARDLKKTLKKLPPALELLDYDPKERIDPSASGTELYSPVHDYEFKGEGKVRGDIEPLIRLQATLNSHEFIKAEAIELSH